MSELDDLLTITWGRAAEGSAPTEAEAALGAGWAVGPAVNGGAVMAVAAAALGETFAGAGHPDLLTWSAFFLSPTAPGPVRLQVEALRSGRTVSTGQVLVLQDDAGGLRERARITATLADLAAMAEPAHRAPAAPPMPPPDACVPARRDGSPLAAAITILDRLDVRIDPATAGFAAGRPTGRGELRAWLRLADGHEPDVAVLPLAVDCLMPVAFDLGVPGWAPTFELTGQVLGRPAPGWLQVRLHADTVAGGVYVEDADVWDSTGRLVARSRQLAGIRVPEGGLPPVAG